MISTGPYHWRCLKKRCSETSPVRSVPSSFLAYIAGKHWHCVLLKDRQSWRALEWLQLIAAKRTCLTYCLLLFTAPLSLSLSLFLSGPTISALKICRALFPSVPSLKFGSDQVNQNASFLTKKKKKNSWFLIAKLANEWWWQSSLCTHCCIQAIFV